MLHDPTLVEQLSAFPTDVFEGDVFRATRLNFEPLAFSTGGGRWAPDGQLSVLYTSLARDGALAEIAFHWGQLTPLPSKKAALHRLGVKTRKTLRLRRIDLESLDLDLERFGNLAYRRTQEIGAVVSYLGRDALIVPSARWDCDNLILFNDNQTDDGDLLLLGSAEVEWQAWAAHHHFIFPQSYIVQEELPLGDVNPSIPRIKP